MRSGQTLARNLSSCSGESLGSSAKMRLRGSDGLMKCRTYFIRMRMDKSCPHFFVLWDECIFHTTIRAAIYGGDQFRDSRVCRNDRIDPSVCRLPQSVRALFMTFAFVFASARLPMLHRMD